MTASPPTPPDSGNPQSGNPQSGNPQAASRTLSDDGDQPSGSASGSKPGRPATRPEPGADSALAARQAAESQGRRAETVAALYLRMFGWRILARRFTVRRGSGAGEVDIIATKSQGAGGVLVFVEVKARPTVAEGLEAVTTGQRRRIAAAAEAYLAQNPAHAGLAVRFDVVVVPPGRRPVHVADAWRPDPG